MPPVSAEYHFKKIPFELLPVATKLETVAVPQKDCADAVGAVGTSFTVTEIAVRVLSHPLTVCEA